MNLVGEKSFLEKFGGEKMFWSETTDEEEEALLCSPALMARRASESWIVAPPAEVWIEKFYFTLKLFEVERALFFLGRGNFESCFSSPSSIYSFSFFCQIKGEGQIWSRI